MEKLRRERTPDTAGEDEEAIPDTTPRNGRITREIQKAIIPGLVPGLVSGCWRWEMWIQGADIPLEVPQSSELSTEQ